MNSRIWKMHTIGERDAFYIHASQIQQHSFHLRDLTLQLKVELVEMFLVTVYYFIQWNFLYNE